VYARFSHMPTRLLFAQRANLQPKVARTDRSKTKGFRVGVRVDRKPKRGSAARNTNLPRLVFGSTWEVKARKRLNPNHQP